MSGTIPLSMTQQLDLYGKPLGGGKLYFFVAASVSTPQNSFQDAALTLPWPNPITLDAYGRIPQFFLADGLIKVRLTDKHGVTQLVADNLQVIGASTGGGGGGGSVDATSVYQTGDLKPRYDTGIHSGWVRANGRTIGNAASAATELAHNTTARALYEHLWNVDPNLVVIPSRGASAAADFDGSKQLTLPDLRGRAIAGMDDMGNTLAGNIPAAVTVTGSTTNASALVTAVSAIGSVSAGMKVTGSGIPAGATVASVGQQLSGTATLDNTVNVTALAGVNATTQLRDGMAVYGSGIQPGTTIAARPTSSTITLSQAAIMPAAGTPLVALTFADPATFTLSAPATATGSGTSLTLSVLAGNVLGATGGTSTYRLSQSQLPNVTLPTAIGAGQWVHSHTVASMGGGGSAGTDVSNPNKVQATSPTTSTATMSAVSGTTPLGGSGAALLVAPPTMVVTVYVKL